MIKRQLELCEIPDAHARTLLDRHATQIAQPWLILRRVQRAMEDLAEEFRRNETADRSLVLYVKRTTSPPHLPRAIYWGRFLSAERAKTSTGEKVSLIEHLGDRLMKGWMSKYASGHELYPRFKAYEPRASALNQARAALKGATKSIRATLRNRYEGAPPFPSPGHPLLDILPADGASALRHSWAVMAWLAAVWRDLNTSYPISRAHPSRASFVSPWEGTPGIPLESFSGLPRNLAGLRSHLRSDLSIN